MIKKSKKIENIKYQMPNAANRTWTPYDKISKRKTKKFCHDEQKQKAKSKLIVSWVDFLDKLGILNIWELGIVILGPGYKYGYGNRYNGWGSGSRCGSGSGCRCGRGSVCGHRCGYHYRRCWGRTCFRATNFRLELPILDSQTPKFVALINQFLRNPARKLLVTTLLVFVPLRLARRIAGLLPSYVNKPLNMVKFFFLNSSIRRQEIILETTKYHCRIHVRSYLWLNRN